MDRDRIMDNLIDAIRDDILDGGDYVWVGDGDRQALENLNPEVEDLISYLEDNTSFYAVDMDSDPDDYTWLEGWLRDRGYRLMVVGEDGTVTDPAGVDGAPDVQAADFDLDAALSWVGIEKIAPWIAQRGEAAQALVLQSIAARIAPPTPEGA